MAKGGSGIDDAAVPQRALHHPQIRARGQGESCRTVPQVMQPHRWHVAGSYQLAEPDGEVVRPHRGPVDTGGDRPGFVPGVAQQLSSGPLVADRRGRRRGELGQLLGGPHRHRGSLTAPSPCDDPALGPHLWIRLARCRQPDHPRRVGTISPHERRRSMPRAASPGSGAGWRTRSAPSYGCAGWPRRRRSARCRGWPAQPARIREP